MSDQYAVMGNPIAQSKSPQIHAEFARQTGQDLCYEKILVPLDGFAQAVRDFFQQGGKGLNVTLPFKLEACQLAHVLSNRAKLAGAANTLLLGKDHRLYADNTDGVGLVRDLQQNQQIAICGKKLLVLGAGGAVRGVLAPLLAEQPAQLVLANRTLIRAQELANLFLKQGRIKALAYEKLNGQSFDLVINGTSASLSGDLPPLPDGLLSAEAACYDMMYGARDTVFMHWARQQGTVRVMDGLGMLVEQAAEAFYLWRQVRPKTQPVIDLIRGELQ